MVGLLDFRLAYEQALAESGGRAARAYCESGKTLAADFGSGWHVPRSQPALVAASRIESLDTLDLALCIIPFACSTVAACDCRKATDWV